MARFSVVVNKFDAGLDTKGSPLNSPLNKSPDLQNVEFDEFGSVRTRSGREPFTDGGISSSRVDMLHSFVKDTGASELMVVAGTTMYRFSGNTAVAVASAISLFTTGTKVQAVKFQNKMWISNGDSPPYKWNGAELTRWGVPVASALTASDGSDGTLTGDYKYVVIGVNSSFVQGDYGSESTDVNVTSKEIDLSEIPVFAASAGVNSKQICRNTALVSGLFYVVTEISNAQTSYTDNHSDGELLTLAPLDEGVPPYFTTMASHQGRVFGASSTSSAPSYLWYSDIITPEVFPSENFLRIGEGDGSYITGIAILSNSLIVSKNDGSGEGSIWFVYTPDSNPINWTVIKLDTESGGQSANVMVKFNNFLAYINKNGVYDLAEFAVGDIKSDALSFNIEPDVFRFSKDFLFNAYAVAWKNKVWFSIPYTAENLPTQEQNNRIYQYDYIRGRSGEERSLGAWSRFTDVPVSCFAIHGGEMYGGSSEDTGVVWKLDTGRDDDGDAIHSYFTTMAMSGLKEHKYHTKNWRFVYVTVGALGKWDMDVEILKDQALFGDVSQVDLDPDSIKYGEAILDEDFWGGGLIKKRIKVVFSNTVAKSIQLKFSTNTAGQYFELNEIEVFYNLRGKRGGD